MRGLLMEVFDSHPYSRYIDQLLYCSVLALINNERSIKYKMCVKLFLWMEKLCAETLSFTQETFELAVKMLVQYISDWINEFFGFQGHKSATFSF
jgi:hypothetical protein